MNPKIIGGVILAAAIAGGAFYGGVAYAKSGQRSTRGNFQGQFAQGQGAQGGGFAGRAGAGGLTSGQIISKDDQTLTIKTPDGSTKIVLYSGSTMVTKSASGTPQDLTQGAQVTVMGSANQDGSMTAQNILIGGGFGGARSFGGSAGQNR